MFLIRCARQCCRTEAGKHSSKARIRPGAPSVAPRIESWRPRRLRSSKNARQHSVDSFEPGESAMQTFLPSSVSAQAHSTASREAPGRSFSAMPSISTWSGPVLGRVLPSATNCHGVRFSKDLRAFEPRTNMVPSTTGCHRGSAVGRLREPGSQV